MPQPGARRGQQPTAHSPQSTAPSPQSTVHSSQPRLGSGPTRIRQPSSQPSLCRQPLTTHPPPPQGTSRPLQLSPKRPFSGSLPHPVQLSSMQLQMSRYWSSSLPLAVAPMMSTQYLSPGRSHLSSPWDSQVPGQDLTPNKSCIMLVKWMWNPQQKHITSV